VKKLSIVLLSMASLLFAQTPDRYDIILRHGTIVDGSGLPRFEADVAIANGFIAKIGDLAAERAPAEFDARGLCVTPGFINIHSHASVGALPRAENMLTQGVTTEILNPDGGGSTDLARQLRDASGAGLAVNIGAYIGFNSVWSETMGPSDRRATTADIEKMRAVIVDGLRHGAWGVSSGLDYKPAYFAQLEEVIRVVEPAAAWRTNFTNHDRLTPESNFSSRVGVGETIAIGEKAGLAPVVTHMKAQGLEQGTAGTLLEMMNGATRRGHYTAADAYPYLAGQTSLFALLVPAWAQDGGRDAMLDRFKDPKLRARIATDIESAMKARFGGPEGVFLPATKEELVEIMREEQAPAGEAVIRILERGNVPAILRFGSEADLVKILQYPATSVACDCGASIDTRQHPRAFGTFPRVLGRYVREQKVLTWEDAIRKMTALPAATIGMIDRGLLASGMAADVTVFDPATVIDRATYEDAGQLSEGIRYVLVNGRIAVRDGRVTGEPGGRVLLRDEHMPTRPMNTVAERQLKLSGKIKPETTVRFAVTQSRNARQAQGTFRLMAPDLAIEATEFGALQTFGRWASFTALGRTRPSSGGPGDARSNVALTVVVDGDDPLAATRGRVIVVSVDGATRVSGVLQ